MLHRHDDLNIDLQPYVKLFLLWKIIINKTNSNKKDQIISYSNKQLKYRNTTQMIPHEKVNKAQKKNHRFSIFSQLNIPATIIHNIITTILILKTTTKVKYTLAVPWP